MGLTYKYTAPVEHEGFAAALRADNWFWVLNASEDCCGVCVERVVAWANSEAGWIGLISPEMEGAVLQEPPPVAGGKYKHLDDLTPLEIEVLNRKKIDPEQRVMERDAF